MATRDVTWTSASAMNNLRTTFNQSVVKSLWQQQQQQRVFSKERRNRFGVEFWHDLEREGWLTKQGEYIKTWRRRWCVLKEGQLFWFKDKVVTRNVKPRGVVNMSSCLAIKSAEDVLNKQNAFQLSTSPETMYFIADSEKEEEDWINSVCRSIVHHSRSITETEVLGYDSQPVK